MSNFLVVSSSNDRSAERIFSAGVRATRAIKGQPASSIVSATGSRAATFARKNGSGTRAVKDQATGVWLLCTGTWLHDDGYATGSENKLLDRWLAAGPRTVAREIEGIFTLVVFDPRTRETVVVTDIAASSMTFFRAYGETIAIAGSSSVLAAMGPATADPLACQELLRSGNVFEDRTTWSEVRRADGASIYRFKDGSLVARERYWSPADVEAETLDGLEAVDALHDALVKVAARLRGIYPKLACDLTGGYDSRGLLAGFLSAQIPFTTTVTGAEDTDDVLVAGRIASELGLRHDWRKPAPPRSFQTIARSAALADFEYDPIEYSYIGAIHDHLSRHHDASVNGSSGELARGSLWLNLSDPRGRRGAWDSSKYRRRKFAESGSNPAMFAAASRYDVIDHWRPMIDRAVEGLGAQPNTNQIDWAYLTVRMHAWQARIASTTDQLWPCMSPFMFRSVLDVMMRMTTRCRWDGWAVKTMFLRHQPKLARIPLARGYPPLPLRVDTVHRLAWPVVSSVVKKVWKKGSRMAGLTKRVPTVGIESVPARVHLWMEPAVRDLFDPASMRTATLFEPGSLEGFLRESQSRDFAHGEQWNRMLGLEQGRRVVESVRRELAEDQGFDEVWSSQRNASAK